MTTFCQDDARRDTVRERPELNGLDYVEVGDDQLTLTVYFLGKAPPQLKKGTTRYLRISGGRRIRGIKVSDVDVTRDPDPEIDDYAVIEVDKPGDFSTYTLQLVGLDGIDPFYDRVEFSFKVNCPSDLDCAPADVCPPRQFPEPDINYLAKDYASFRQLILDRLALIMPDWQERHVPDIGITLVELLAYVGDHLSYYQDAVATEAYLDTARRRISVRRHARLVDYVLHEGCNARCWLIFITDTDLAGDKAIDPRDVYFITSLRDEAGIKDTILTADDLRNVPTDAFEPFEAMTCQPIEVYAFQSRISFYTWGERECCLPKGATSAVLMDAWESSPTQKATTQPPSRKLRLTSGDTLIFEEVLGPGTGQAADADPAHRHAVRLTSVKESLDPLNGQPLVEIEWPFEDALPFALCLSATTDADHGCIYHEDISIAYGNVVLVDHGYTIEPCEDLGAVPVEHSEADCLCEEQPSDVRVFSGPFRPRLSARPLTYSQALPAGCPAGGTTGMLAQDPRQALPQAYLTSILTLADQNYHLIDWAALSERTDLAKALSAVGFDADCYAQGIPLSPKLYTDYIDAETAKTELTEALKKDPDNQKLKDDYSKAVTTGAELLQALISDLTGRHFCWVPRIDLLGSESDERHFVCEIDNEGEAWLRFGDDECGLKPEAASAFLASYRIGNGTSGNVGAESIAHMVCRREKISGAGLTIRNPLPASGGLDAEPIAEAKLFAPSAFRDRLMRAVIADDYAALAEREFKTWIEHAAAVLAWTGSWFEADVVIDPLGSEKARHVLLERIECTLQHFRRMGHDLEVKPARYVPIDLELTVCVLPDYLRGHVKAALLAIFGNRLLPDGRLGFFHPDNLSFGEGLYLSRIVAAAQAVTGVRSVRVTKLNRLFEPPNRELENGVLTLGPLEVAQLDNDPSFPERGKLALIIQGGR
jgi:hypothetical protein